MAKTVRMRRTLKRVGVLLCAAILLLAIVSTWCGFAYRADSYGMGVYGGTVWFKTLDGTPSDVQKVGPSWRIPKGWSYHFGTWSTRELFSWPKTYHHESSRTHLISRLFGRPDNGLQGTVIHTWYLLPLWMPLIPVGLPTIFLIWRDRRRYVPGRCVLCDYDLTGNVSGRCPECGTSCLLRSLWRIRLRRLLGCVRPGLAALILLLGSGLWFYSQGPSKPRIIVAIGPDGGALYFTRLRPRKPDFLHRLTSSASKCHWDGEWLSVSGRCESCRKPSAKRYSFVLAKLPGGLAYATLDSSTPDHEHLTKPKYLSVGIIFLLMAAASSLIMLSPYLLPRARKLFAARSS